MSLDLHAAHKNGTTFRKSQKVEKRENSVSEGISYITFRRMLKTFSCKNVLLYSVHSFQIHNLFSNNLHFPDSTCSLSLQFALNILFPLPKCS